MQVGKALRLKHKAFTDDGTIQFFVSADWENSFYVFDRILSEIGDNQSIENELSTYSYRLQK